MYRVHNNSLILLGSFVFGYGMNKMLQMSQMASGLIVGGADRGVVSMYDAKKLIKGENALIFSQVGK